jgi:catechol 2,3-dioxygenase-like lactoylglutathione lyase family enzyme
MKKLFLILTLMAMSFPTGTLWAQLYPPNEAGVSLGAWHTIVRDIDTTTKWWELWGGTPMKIDGVDVMKFHGVFIFMVKGEPNGPSIDHFIDHIAFMTTDGYGLLKKLTDAGVRTDDINLATMRSPRWTPKSDQRTWTYTYSPDGLRVEVETKEGLEWATPQEAGQKDFMTTVSSDMMHMYFKDLAALRASYKFYKANFGGVALPDANINLHMPGTKLNYATDTGRPEEGATPFKTGEVKIRAKGTPRPANKGSALDYIGFEVVNLPGFVKKLEAAGVTFDEPYSTTRHKGYASAMFTGPGGEIVELTEGLRKYN